MSGGIDFKQIALLSLYGLAMIWSPIFGTTEAITFPLLYEFENEILASRVFNLASYGATMGIMAIIGDRVKEHVHHRGFIAAIVAIGCAGMLLGALAGMLVVPSWCLCAGAVGRGAFNAIITLLWINELMRLKDASIGITVSAALCVYAVVGLAIVCIATVLPAAGAVLLAACPTLSCLACVRASKTFENKDPIPEENSSLPARSRALVYTANFVFGAMLGALLHYYAFYDTPESIGTFFSAALVLLVVFASPAGRLGLHSVYRGFIMAFAIATPGIVLMVWAGWEVSAAAASAALVVVVMYALVIFTDTQARVRKPFWRVPGCAQVFAAAGMIASSVAVYFTYPDGGVPGLYLLLFAGACLMFIAGVFSPSARSSIRPWGFSSLVPEEPWELKSLRRCGELAQERKLTSRELEILQMLVAGSTRDDIAATFVISPATVKTHIRNIYAKLEVHSRSELMDLVRKV